ncbi:retropepsin-like aspartic protease [Flavobacterium sp. NKUCC04_CG]|uniref:retropepsin-like aspartic protease n=1 Tax=Flavobacterium sp. NKUCC04_CG TaxID=2842121 RepID=UPI001C5BAF61|nr:retropepsin-like aspartic protease [Flavobacterium sp. NKUCC04_CG]MBW3518380.1 retroviral-like aspartic protease family protein [Flavobacterium sp. NKUCC04_CG]
MENLQELLLKNGYRKIAFTVSKTQHLFLKAKINGISGDFILDTGASNSCIDFSHIEHFNIEASDSNTKASGAGANGMLTQVSYQNKLQMGRWKNPKTDLILLDLSHVNIALKQYKAKTVHGIIGADVLLRGEALIDYKNKYLFLK